MMFQIFQNISLTFPFIQRLFEKKECFSRFSMFSRFSDNPVPEQVALAAICYFGQVFVLYELINKNALKWFLLTMCKEHTLSSSTNLLQQKPSPIMLLIKRRRSADVTVQNPITIFQTVTFLNYGSVCLEFFQSVTFEQYLRKKQPSSFHEHKHSIFISCLR